jgi:hypothetical protein
MLLVSNIINLTYATNVHLFACVSMCNIGWGTLNSGLQGISITSINSEPHKYNDQIFLLKPSAAMIIGGSGSDSITVQDAFHLVVVCADTCDSK